MLRRSIDYLKKLRHCHSKLMDVYCCTEGVKATYLDEKSRGPLPSLRRYPFHFFQTRCIERISIGPLWIECIHRDVKLRKLQAAVLVAWAFEHIAEMDRIISPAMVLCANWAILVSLPASVILGI